MPLRGSKSQNKSFLSETDSLMDEQSAAVFQDLNLRELLLNCGSKALGTQPRRQRSESLRAQFIGFRQRKDQLEEATAKDKIRKVQSTNHNKCMLNVDFARSCISFASNAADCLHRWQKHGQEYQRECGRKLPNRLPNFRLISA